MDLIAVVDTMFARVNMGDYALNELQKCSGYEQDRFTKRATVPGFKDLTVESKRLIEFYGAQIVLILARACRVKPILTKHAHTKLLRAL